MNKRFPILVLLLIVLNGCTSKTNDETATANNDSIQKYIALAGNETLPFDKRIKYNDKALGFIDLERNDSLTRENFNLIVYNYLICNDWDKFKKYAKHYYEKAAKLNDTLGLARYYRYKGCYYIKKNIYDSAFYFCLKSEKLYKKIKNEEGLAFVNSNISHIKFKLDDYLGSELSAKKAFGYFVKTKNTDRMFHLLVNVGNTNHNLNHYEKAIEKFKQALQMTNKINYEQKQMSYIGTCLNNIGNTYRVQKRYKEAIYYFKLGLEEKNITHKDPEIYAYLLNNLGYCYLKTNRQIKLPDLFEESKKIFDSLGIKNESAVCDIYLSEYFSKKGDSLKANLHAESALKLAKDSKASYYYLTALSHAGSINPKKAAKYIKDYHRINDSLLFVERNARNQYYKIQLETDEISQEKETALKQRSLVLAIALTLLFISVLIIVIARQRIKQKELRLKQSQQKANEELYQLLLNQKDSEEKARYLEKKRIAMELHDGVMNKLTSTRLNLSVLSIKKDEATIEKCLGYIKEINLVENEIRNITHDLNREAFHSSNSFSKLLEDFVEEQNGISNTYFILEVDSSIDWNIISNITKMNLYRIIQETVHNINKHAKAQKGIINLIMDRKNICLSVIDDGVGIEFSTNEQGIGLKNIEHRVKQLKGKLNIHSKSNSGTSINISLPLEKAD